MLSDYEARERTRTNEERLRRRVATAWFRRDDPTSTSPRHPRRPRR